MLAHRVLPGRAQVQEVKAPERPATLFEVTSCPIGQDVLYRFQIALER